MFTPLGLLSGPGKGGARRKEQLLRLFQTANMVCVSTYHSCCPKNRWDSDLPVELLEPCLEC